MKGPYHIRNEELSCIWAESETKGRCRGSDLVVLRGGGDGAVTGNVKDRYVSEGCAAACRDNEKKSANCLTHVGNEYLVEVVPLNVLMSLVESIENWISEPEPLGPPSEGGVVALNPKDRRPTPSGTRPLDVTE